LYAIDIQTAAHPVPTIAPDDDEELAAVFALAA
jgi:hypothetical protein